MISFIAITNQSGIVCASNSDNTVHRLSKEEPVAIAVNPSSRIPWVDLINKYRRLGEPARHESIEEYAKDFEKFLGKQPADEKWTNISTDEANIIFMGYGVNDIYASVYDVMVALDPNTQKLRFDFAESNKIAVDDNVAYWNLIGDFDSVSAVLYGSKRNVRELSLSKTKEALEIFRNRVMEAAKEAKLDERIIEQIKATDCEQEAFNIVDNATGEAIDNAIIGLGTFSIEEMVYAAEKLVNANVRLNRLVKGDKRNTQGTKEIAVITKTEGLTWIKHNLFAI